MTNPYVLLGGLLLAIGLFFSGIHTGKKLERTDWQAKELKAQAQYAKDKQALIDQNEKDRAGYVAATKKASESHAKEIELVTATHTVLVTKRVRLPAGFCMPAPSRAGSGTSPGGDGKDATPSQFLPDAFTTDLRQIVLDADIQLADLRQVITAAKAAKCFEGY